MGGKCSEILATMKLLQNPRVNKVFIHSLLVLALWFALALEEQYLTIFAACYVSRYNERLKRDGLTAKSFRLVSSLRYVPRASDTQLL